MNKKKLGKMIRKLRRDKDITQMQLAIKIGRTPSTVSMWEKGKKTPSLEMYLRLVKILKLKTEEALLCVNE